MTALLDQADQTTTYDLALEATSEGAEAVEEEISEIADDLDLGDDARQFIAELLPLAAALERTGIAHAAAVAAAATYCAARR